MGKELIVFRDINFSDGDKYIYLNVSLPPRSQSNGLINSSFNINNAYTPSANAPIIAFHALSC